MAASGFGLTGNNAPPPPAGNWNITGNNSGVPLNSGTTFPNFPMFGNNNTNSTPMSSNAPLFSGTGIAGLSSGFANTTSGNQYENNFYNMLGKAYGQGTGQLVGNLIEQGMFNPQIAAAFLNAMQPSINQGEASVLNAFGAQGSRFGSAASLGLSNFLGQANLNEQQTLASMYMQAQQDQLQLLEGVMPTIHQERANSGSWVNDLVGGLEIAGSIAAVPFTGGMSLMALPAGISELNGGINAGPGAPSNPAGVIPNPSTMIPSINPYALNTGTFGSNAPTWDQYIQDWMANEQSQTAGASLGGVDSSSSSSSLVNPYALVP